MRRFAHGSWTLMVLNDHGGISKLGWVLLRM
nr:MAG TPA: hypothetical protein [Caudoviricetes sp.]